MSPKIRESLYYLGTIITAVMGLGLIWGGLEQNTVDSVGDIVAGIAALLGSAAPATAAAQVNKQRKDGTFDVLSPAEQVAAGVRAAVEAQEAAEAGLAAAAADLDKVKQVVTGHVSVVPGMGPLAQQVINAVHLPFGP